MGSLYFVHTLNPFFVFMKDFKIVNELFYQVTRGLCSFEFQTFNSPNIKVIGYSLTLKQLYVEMNNAKRYIYQDVPMKTWNLLGEEIIKSDGIPGPGYASIIKGAFRFYETDEYIKLSSASEVLRQHNELQHFHACTCGLFAIDRIPSEVNYEWIKANAFQIEPFDSKIK